VSPFPLVPFSGQIYLFGQIYFSGQRARGQSKKSSIEKMELFGNKEEKEKKVGERIGLREG
jgi:hypothetical protein